MPRPIFEQLNDDWNADPVDPDGQVSISDSDLRFAFFLGAWGAYTAEEGETGRLIFRRCAVWRRGVVNDEGWYRGQCRYSSVAPAWGEFYEILGDDDRRVEGGAWHRLAPLTAEHRHFLFYMKDEVLECFAVDWSFERGPVCLWPAHPSFGDEPAA